MHPIQINDELAKNSMLKPGGVASGNRQQNTHNRKRYKNN